LTVHVLEFDTLPRHPIFKFKKLRQMAFKMTPLGERGVEAG
jgi:hypothetical protein